MPRIALLGDFSETVVAHRAIPLALQRAAEELQSNVAGEWVHTSEVTNAERDLADFDALWIVPASPYQNMVGVLDAIRWGAGDSPANLRYLWRFSAHAH